MYNVNPLWTSLCFERSAVPSYFVFYLIKRVRLMGLLFQVYIEFDEGLTVTYFLHVIHYSVLLLMLKRTFI